MGTHLNGDESMTFGASFLAANLSHSFILKDIHLNDGYSHECVLIISNLDENIASESENYYYKKLVLFPYKKKFGYKKTITLTAQ